MTMWAVNVQANAAWNGMQAPSQPPIRGRRYPNGSGPPTASAYTMESDALVAVLQEQFPLYNQDSLTDVLKVSLPAHAVPCCLQCRWTSSIYKLHWEPLK